MRSANVVSSWRIRLNVSRILLIWDRAAALFAERNSFLFAFIAAGVVQCGGLKMSHRTSTIVQFIFYF